MSQSMTCSIDVLKFDLDELYLRSNKNGYAVVDEVKVKGDGVAVYVRGDSVNHNSPPRKLNEKMLEHGYAYVDWVVNGQIGDERALFEYTQI